ncbi:class I SAM-dependent methyltransferase [Streptomyces sudanensis]|uniref:Class I SAM-dependent methyltransferase n=1 Tax=Streptomyces sudanensis TaxID=436397 RepID=A0ABY4TKG5_9ACTN|nr:MULTISPECIES: class I SAM-dependent methyltransferase [Streptomyces]MCP9985864.1 class I SAM-dependent methyltransferase [Streptomyces sudanensis]URN17500.1 class I SAM-dependent methyltransferase [Streptomyces sudanensis]
MPDTRSAAWDTYAASKPNRRETNARGEKTWFNWTQHPDHGPGATLLDLREGQSVLDLGCGSGGNLAHLATLGMRAVGVDVSHAQIAKARERWPDVDMEIHRGDALEFLAGRPTQFDAIFSVFGAAYFTDPDLMLPAVHKRLKPGGVFAMSQNPPIDGCYGCQASFIPRGPDEDPAIVKRWDYPSDVWAVLLKQHGFEEVAVTVLPAPEGRKKRIGTLLVRGRRGRG